jgi:hypothetical protein
MDDDRSNSMQLNIGGQRPGAQTAHALDVLFEFNPWLICPNED